MTNLENIKDILQNYNYKADKPIFSAQNYQVHYAVQKQTKLQVNIKIIKSSNPTLVKYLKKLKDCKSQNTIRIYQVYEDPTKIILVTECCQYGNLYNALNKCERLQENDAITVAKMLLNGYVDLLRTDCTWVGNQNDIQFTETGVKLSWNNFYDFKAQNCLSKVIQRLVRRQSDMKNILPFPKSKVIEQLIKISRQSASQISMNANMKKKQKSVKKKGKNWIAVKDNSYKNQYLEQNIYLAVSKTQGFVKVKIYELGTINHDLLNLNKGKPGFTKVISYYEQSNKSILISQYSNDGSLQNYITKLKSLNVKLTQQHIQFFFYSLFQPLKLVQQSSIKSINMLHIRNIFIEKGIPKIGEPYPINQKLIQNLNIKKDLPDFYHSQFKQNPTKNSQSFDTYSLGVLLYKLMYTQYPIFPDSKVHIPTVPNYNKRLKTTLQIFLNEGGTLKSLQSKIEISDNVKNQVKQNKNKLDGQAVKMNRQISIQLSKRSILADVQQTQDNFQAQKKSSQKSQQNQQTEDQLNCCSLCCHALDFTQNQKALNRYVRITNLQQSPYKMYRICTKILLILVFYIFVYFFFFLNSNINFLTAQKNLQTYNVSIATTNYPIIINDVQIFQTSYNKTSRNVDALFNGLGCLIDGYNGNPVYSDFIVNSPSAWIFYLVASLLCFVLFMLLKVWQTYSFDLIKVVYNWDHAVNNFNISHFIIYNLSFCCLIYGHFYFFNFIFTGQLSPCLGGTNTYYQSSQALLNNISKFELPYMTTFILQIVVVLAQWIMIWRSHQVSYNKLINPIVLFAPFLITQWIIIRIGVLDNYFAPNAIHDNTIIKNYFINGKYVNILGTIPQILWILQILIGLLVDFVYWCFLDKRRRLLIQETSAASLSQNIIR